MTQWTTAERTTTVEVPAQRTSTPDARALLDECRTLVEPALRDAVDSLPGLVRHLCGYHMGWWDADGRPETGGSGKAVRPALTLLSADAAGGTRSGAVAGAVAVELVHNFSLLHDDVMDRDPTRRHRPTVWAEFGTGPAILAGDAMLALALDVLAAERVPAPDGGRTPEARLAACVQELVEGQMDDLAFEHRDDVELAECLRMAERKTGALLGAACAVGAGCAGAAEPVVRGLDEFGRGVGVAFQLVDDLLGIWGDPMRTGKPVRSDLRSRKKSLPVVAALRSPTTEAYELDVLYTRERDLSEAELERAAVLVERAGARDWAAERIDTLTAAALVRMHAWDPPREQAAALRSVARLLTRRDH
jgi:geranylgeranyl diphosphate synthase, type I